MSIHTEVRRLTIPQLVAYKGKQKIVSLTSYSAPFARLLDAHVDMILIGDSTAMVGYALPDTLSFSADQIAAHVAAVVRATKRACVLADMPFGSYQGSMEQAFTNAAKMVAAGAAGVKLEGGAALAPVTQYLVERGIPVMGHVGLMPQYVNVMGGFKAQGMTEEAAERVFQDALAHERAGAFGILLEGTAEGLARRITEAVSVPTIGIGASPHCDGQVLVTEDILGLSGGTIPRFAHQFADVGAVIDQAVADYAAGVREGTFPTLDHCFGVKK